MAYSEYDEWDLRSLAEQIFLRAIVQSERNEAGLYDFAGLAKLSIETAKEFEKVWNEKVGAPDKAKPQSKRKKGKA
jgi:hypothetical protein